MVDDEQYRVEVFGNGYYVRVPFNAYHIANILASVAHRHWDENHSDPYGNQDQKFGPGCGDWCGEVPILLQKAIEEARIVAPTGAWSKIGANCGCTFRIETRDYCQNGNPNAPADVLHTNDHDTTHETWTRKGIMRYGHKNDELGFVW